MIDTRPSAVADVYAGDTATAQHAAAGAVFTYEIRTDVEPDVLVRIAAICNLANVAPRHMSLAREEDGIQVRIELDAITGATAESIRRKLLQLTCVNSVSLTYRDS